MDINRTLETAPAKISELAVKVEDLRVIWKKGELELELLESKTHLILKAHDPDMTQSDLKASIAATDDVYLLKMKILSLESDYKKATIEFNKWTDAFNSARKLANVKIEEMRSLNGTVK